MSPAGAEAGNLAQHLPRSCPAQTGDTGTTGRGVMTKGSVYAGFELNVFHKYIFCLAGGYSALKISSAITAVRRQDWAAQADSL